MRLTLLAFVAGCWWLQGQAALPGTVALLAAALLPLCLMLVAGRWYRGSPWPRLACQWMLAALCGFGWAAWRAEHGLAGRLDPAAEGLDIEVTGVVSGLPAAAAQGVRFLFAVERSATPVPAQLSLAWYDAPPDLLPGQRYDFTVRLRRPHGLANPHGFDYEVWLLQRGIGATGHVRAVHGPAREAVAGSFAWRIARWRARLRQRIRAALPADARFAPVLVALVVGDQRGIGPDDWRLFTRTGIGHLISISGLHITMISGLVAALAQALWRRSFGLAHRLRRPLPLRCPARRVALLAAVGGAFGYGLMAGMEVPAQRTVAMVAAGAIALWRDRAPPASLVLAWAAFAAVALDPWAVLSAGFWLSFGAVAVIFLAASEERGVAGQGAWARLRATLAAAGRTQWAVTIGLVPLTLALFQQISVVSPLANAVAIPVVSLAVTPAALVGALSPSPLAGLLLGAAHALLEWLAWLLHWLSQPAWAVWEARAPRLSELLLAAVGTLLMLAPAAFGLRARLHGLLLLLPMLCAGREPVAAGEFRAIAFDVGQGTAVLVLTRAHALLYDAGPIHGPPAEPAPDRKREGVASAPPSSAGERVIVPYLRATGVRSLDVLMVSHEDADHAGGVRDVMAAVPVGRLLTGAPARHPLLLPPAGTAAPMPAPCEAGMGWEWDGVRFDVLHPAPGDAGNAAIGSNARSCVLRIATGASSLLLTGDIDRASELAIIGRGERGEGPESRATVLLAPHHGSATSSTDAFLAAVAPEAALFQLGYRNRYHHPHPDVWRRYARHGVARYRADATGAVEMITASGGYRLAPFRQTQRRYWREAPAAPE
ncbi:DNA internalization-related competence protein ComEC/Rec2 [Cupriavidus respiraculi]|uniref:ComE operon protein 3 n=1 Tax=Cupriavidus respiraculi TaxID=195930 RepID=A0ABN7YM09_9BURK|nr:DNA internalization-related competence protein ComEC/Rec2 [Cupriavidus respiraculi]CAG9172882.1 ComE operon protein 3 [Cupriavidus respiraculi]